MGKTGDSLLLSKTPKFLAVLIIFLATTQLGLHFWPLSSLVYGIRIDYLSPTLYFLDILILLYLGLELRSLRDFRRAIVTFATSTLLPLLLTNLLFSQNPLSTLNWSLHLLIYCSFIFSLKKEVLNVIPNILVISLAFQLILGLTQFYLGHSVGGLMYYLGERMVAVGAPGIATTTFMDQVVLRAYGTFSHPNIFAGWAVISLLIILQLSPKLRSLRDFRRVIVTFVTAIIIFLSNSRSALLSLFLFVIPIYFLHSLKSRFIYFSIFICSLFFVLQSSPSPRTDLSFSERLNLQQVSLNVVSAYPIFGTGSQSSISTYPLVSPATRLLQPDHNSFTLFLSWFGLFGIFAISPWFSKLRSLRDFRRVIVTFAIPLLPLLLLDHYLLTSPQGLFVLLLYLSVAVNYSHAQKNRQ